MIRKANKKPAERTMKGIMGRSWGVKIIRVQKENKNGGKVMLGIK